ncbi:TetR family transcriptional regulator C-terminal domain-containing protein [Streptomyces sp. SKN60]|uniref:TetR/AcrR family transcriptional regulator n=1 Tax=Streptomyces sp. SKN60 TaxID=2855506 RepID=UPI002247907D|nr:TetR family transcriptional regulator C-terminal domain-containing protein [Streptomyces sp. SKN60]MCX2182859.1 TetR family transcriptional regulator C-terminal domain-containing protein [Streptomyces sp. SKN60]
MPKQVDPEARRREVVDALFRVVVREGLQRASLRNVADEAGLNIGSLRHYFASQQELMRFAMQSMLDRVGARLLERVADMGELGSRPYAEQLRLATGLLAELLPLDERRRAEVTVFLDFNTAARTDPAFADLSRRTAEGARGLVRRVLGRLDATGALRPGLDLDVETERLASLLDGLGLNAVLHPGLLAPEACLDVLTAHLEGLADGGTVGGGVD